ncbi:hypothetical protein SAMN02745945_01746 [Peptoclostridium litorale DSM 5388]|uniref:Uncharacterized protein n=1 Tax=Peptoclostridium litorale DSM 5388 TaxID=1121324 RepID=A0A069RG33_PEPLI|nr:hypothetical protein [Peptoclostridium litorale]KDR95981.1 hypothetical protein CLIT_8c01500 [Peptoclostridium litorale DSM 5388]SIO08737.1 hypothetical protein SAMN02745945_01746 [Peptoclostridium litorale DSM 5388]
MKNNVKALLLHLVIVGVSFIILIIFVGTAPTLGKYTTNIVMRVPLAIVLISPYVYVGTLLDTNIDKKYDFLTGSIIVIIGAGLWAYAFLATGKISHNLPEELSIYWILFNAYHTPFTMIYFLLGIPKTPLLGLLTNLFPSLLIGTGLSYKRLRM